MGDATLPKVGFFDSPLGAAILRGSWQAIGIGLSAGLLIYQQLYNVDLDQMTAGIQRSPDITTQAMLAGLIAGLAALGFRGGIEGSMDQSRRNALEKDLRAGHTKAAAQQVNKSDVGYVLTPGAGDPSVHG